MKSIQKLFGITLMFLFVIPMANAVDYCPPDSMRGTIPDSYFQNCTPPPAGFEAPPSGMDIPTDIPEGSLPEEMPDLSAAKAEIQKGLNELKKNIPRLKDMIEAAKENNISLGDFEEVYRQVEEKLKKAEEYFNQDDLMKAGDIAKELKAMNLMSKINSIKQKLNKLVQNVDVDQILSDIERMVKGIRKMKRVAQVKMVDTAEIDEMLKQLEPLYKDLAEAATQDDKALVGKLLQQVQALSLKEKMDYFLKHSSALNFKEAFKQIERSIKVAEKAIEKAKEKNQDTTDLKALVKKAKGWLKEAKEKFEDKASPARIGVILEKIEALRWNEVLDNTFHSLHKDSFKAALEEGFAVVRPGIEKMDKLITKLKEEKVDVTPLLNLSSKIKGLFKEAKDYFNKQDYQKAGIKMDQLAQLSDVVKKFMDRYLDRLNKVEVDELNLTPLKKLPAEFLDNFESEVQGKMDSMFKDFSSDKRNALMDFIVGQGQEQAEQLVNLREDNPEAIDKVFDLILKAPENYRRGLIEQKKQLVERTTELEKNIDALKELKKLGTTQERQLKEIIEKVKNYNFYGESGEEMGNAIENFVAEALEEGKSRAQIMRGVRELSEKHKVAIEKAVKEKYDNQIIPFKDTDDQEWYTDYVRFVKGNGIVSGYKDSDGNPLGEYRPGNQITYVEGLKIALEAAGHGKAESSERTKNNAANYHSWAKPYVKKAEEIDLPIMRWHSMIDNPIARITAVQLVLDAFGAAPIGTDENTQFTDVNCKTDKGLIRGCRYIQKAADLGIVSGNPDGTFAPHRGVNRAEMAKIIMNAVQILGK